MLELSSARWCSAPSASVTTASGLQVHEIQTWPAFMAAERGGRAAQPRLPFPKAAARASLVCKPVSVSASDKCWGSVVGNRYLSLCYMPWAHERLCVGMAWHGPPRARVLAHQWRHPTGSAPPANPHRSLRGGWSPSASAPPSAPPAAAAGALAGGRAGSGSGRGEGGADAGGEQHPIKRRNGLPGGPKSVG